MAMTLHFWREVNNYSEKISQTQCDLFLSIQFFCLYILDPCHLSLTKKSWITICLYHVSYHKLYRVRQTGDCEKVEIFEKVKYVKNVLSLGIWKVVYIHVCVADNWALIYSQQLALAEKLPLHICFCLVPEFLDAAYRQYAFMIKGLQEVVKVQKYYIRRNLKILFPGLDINKYQMRQVEYNF